MIPVVVLVGAVIAAVGMVLEPPKKTQASNAGKQLADAKKTKQETTASETKETKETPKNNETPAS